MGAFKGQGHPIRRTPSTRAAFLKCRTTAIARATGCQRVDRAFGARLLIMSKLTEAEPLDDTPDSAIGVRGRAHRTVRQNEITIWRAVGRRTARRQAVRNASPTTWATAPLRPKCSF